LGERLGERSEAEAIWTRMQCLNEHFPGWDIGVLTNYNGFESFFGRAASSVKELTNGAIQTYYHYFEGGRTRNVHRSKT
jgi:putative N6-adenine-specific DNA methylase